MQIVFGILAIAAGAVGGIMLGVIGLGITLIFAGLAFFFAARAKKNGGSSAAGIVTGVIGLVFGLLTTLLMVGIAGYVSDRAEEKNLPILKECGSSLKFGVMGLAVKSAEKNINIDDMKAEFDIISETTENATTTEAPSTSEE